MKKGDILILRADEDKEWIKFVRLTDGNKELHMQKGFFTPEEARKFIDIVEFETFRGFKSSEYILDTDELIDVLI